MNIIDAWKKAKVGQQLIRVGGIEKNWVKRNGDFDGDLHDAVKYAINEMCVSSETWEIVPTQHKKEITFLQLKQTERLYDGSIPDTAKVTIEWTD